MLLAFDLDKTIVTNDYQLPQEIIDALNRARKAGHEVTVLTGRPFLGAAPVVNQLGLRAPHSVNHGAQVLNPDGKEIRRIHMPGKDADAIVADHLMLEEIDFSMVVNDKMHVKNIDNPRWNFTHVTERHLTPYLPGTLELVDKVVFHSVTHAGHLNELVELAFPRMQRYMWSEGFLEVVPEHADKGSALAFIADKLGYEQKDVVAFGDGSNDVTMIGWAGHGVAVGPWAHEDVLKNAQEHIPSPEELGVAAWIETNLGV